MPPRAQGWSKNGRSTASSNEADTILVPINLREILYVFRRRLWIVVSAVALCLAGAFVLGFGAEPKYEATATFRVRDARGSIAGGFISGLGDEIGGRAVDPLLSQIEALTSRSVAALVVDSLPVLRARPRGYPAEAHLGMQIGGSVRQRDSLQLAFGAESVTVWHGARSVRAAYGAPMAIGGVSFAIRGHPPADSGTLVILDRDAAIDYVLGHLTVRPRPNTDVADVIFKDTDARLAQEAVNRVVTTFQRASAEDAHRESIRRRRFLEDQLQRNDKLLAEARRELSAFRGRTNMYSTRDKFTADQLGLSQLRMRREELDAERRAYRSLLDGLQADSSRGAELGALLTAAGVGTNPIVAKLYEQLSGYIAVRDSLMAGPWARSTQNPDVRRLNAMITSTQVKLTNAARSVVAVLDARIAALDQLQRQNSTNYQSLSANEAEESRLTEQVGTASRISEQLREEYRKAQVAEAVDVGKVDIVDFAKLPVKPVGLPLSRRLFFGLLLGLLLGGAAAFLAEHFDTSIRRQEDLEDSMQLRGLVVLPPFDAKALQRLLRKQRRSGHEPLRVAGSLVAVADPSSDGSEAFRALRTKLQLLRPGEDGRRMRSVLVTSPAPKDGKTTVAANLAAVFAQQDLRVLLVDCDTRRPSTHHVFKIALQPGLTTLVAGDCQPQMAIRSTPLARLSVLPAGAPSRHPVELFSSEAMRRTLEWLMEQYDVVVFDTPPVLAAADALVLSTFADGVLLVARAGQTGRVQAQLAVQQLADVGANVLGAVLNDPDAKVLHSGGSYYYYGYAAQA